MINGIFYAGMVPCTLQNENLVKLNELMGGKDNKENDKN
jgi:hypothetical protein